MNELDKLLNINIQNKEQYTEIFSKTVEQIKNNQFKFEFGDFEKELYFLVIEENRMNSLFVHIVPKEIYKLFKEIQLKVPNQFLGFSVLANKYKNKDVRVSCFGIECRELGKALFLNKKKTKKTK